MLRSGSLTYRCLRYAELMAKSINSQGDGNHDGSMDVHEFMEWYVQECHHIAIKREQDRHIELREGPDATEAARARFDELDVEQSSRLFAKELMELAEWVYSELSNPGGNLDERTLSTWRASLEESFAPEYTSEDGSLMGEMDFGEFVTWWVLLLRIVWCYS